MKHQFKSVRLENCPKHLVNKIWTILNINEANVRVQVQVFVNAFSLLIFECIEKDRITCAVLLPVYHYLSDASDPLTTNPQFIIILIKKIFFFISRGIAKVGEPNNISPLTTGIMYMDPAVHTTLRRKQRRLVRDNPGVLAALVKGANLAISECQHQFRNRRWNCSTKNFLRGKNIFGKFIDKGEFIVALTLNQINILLCSRITF